MSTEKSQPSGISGEANLIEVDETSPKKRKLTSQVWKDFTKYKGPKGQDVAKCNHCKRDFVGESSKDICKIQLHLRKWETSEHDCLHLMAGPMKEKYEKYWDKYSLVLAIAVVLDLRFKMDMVQFYYNKIYESDAGKYVQRVRSAFVDLYNEYGGSSSNTSYDVHDDGRSSSVNSQLDTIEDECSMSLIVARMALDILAVPTTTVASEAAFSMGGKIIDESRSCLLPDIVEALDVCMPVMDGLQATRLIRSFEETSNWDAAVNAGIKQHMPPSNSSPNGQEFQLSTKRIPIIAISTLTLVAA
ncbi:hypothetical protein F0562_007544 [Nyssa sinensis]|uniref:BED-type domain-containing protein n=1 Tax=Nyssa sinensis TaxID=561372 RepID=A0A5J5A600_9ASTE|nr:hypothetical protein F0562_007544 [Nyssa sinensis]